MRIAILVSGRGSNMLQLCDSIAEMQLPVEVALVASNKECAGITAASERGIATIIHDRAHFADKRGQEQALAASLRDAAIDWVFLAGYMDVLSADFVTEFADRIINIHPSLLPEFKGLDTHERALAAQSTHHGASVHLVTAALDDGPLIAQAGLAISPGETADELSARVLQLEHCLYPLVLGALAKAQLSLEGGTVDWTDLPAALVNLPPAKQALITPALRTPAL